MKENRSDCKEVKYHPYSKLPSKQVLEELTNDFPNVDLSKNPIKGNMGEVLQILFAMVIQETLNGQVPFIPSSDLPQPTTITHLNILSNDHSQCNEDSIMKEQTNCIKTRDNAENKETNEPFELNDVPSTSCGLSTTTPIKSPVTEEPESD